MAWLTRTATVALVVLLGAGPTAAAVCEAICAGPHVSAPSAAEVSHHGHARPAPAAHHHSAASSLNVAHAEGSAVASPAATVHDVGTAAARDSRSTTRLGENCCRGIAKPFASLAASRIDRDILPGSLASLIQAAAIISIALPNALAPTHGSPPGGDSPGRAPLVLRI